MYSFCLWGKRISQAGNQQDAAGDKTLKWRQCIPPKYFLTSTELHSITSHKTVMFIVTVLRISNPAARRKFDISMNLING
jgi:hypothetical protein